MKQRLFKLGELKPVDPSKHVRIQGLPGKMVLINPTKTEMAIITLYAEELRKLRSTENDAVTT
jgi:hypothetical protein